MKIKTQFLIIFVILVILQNHVSHAIPMNQDDGKNFTKSTITMVTNRGNYANENNVTISVHVPTPDKNTSLKIQVIDPHLVVRDSHIFLPSLNENYTWIVMPRGPLFVNSGNYTVIAQYGNETSITSFYLISTPSDIIQKNSFMTPLSQFKSGILTKDVTCKQELQLIIKAEDGSPACVRLNTAQILIEHGWAKSLQ